MPPAILALSAQRVGVLRAGYAAIVSRRRLHNLAAFAVLLVAIAVAAWVAEIDPATVCARSAD